jgi:acetyl esterase/lipase
MTVEMIPAMRQQTPIDLTEEAIEAAGAQRRDVAIESYEGGEITISIVSKKDRSGSGPGIFHTHGGGMVAGNRMTGMRAVLPWIVANDAVAVTAEYRLAPEFPDPYPVEDGYATLVWMHDQAADLGIDANQC